MKRICMWILAAVLVFSLCGCGKSEAVKNVEDMIDSIGTVTADSLTAIDAAMEAYEALTEEEVEKVENYSVLAEARDACLEMHMTGGWVYEPKYFYNVEEMYADCDITLNEDKSADGEYVSGTWRVEDGKLKINNGEYDVQYTIYRDNGDIKIGSGNSKMMRTEDFKALLDEMFVIVEVTPENVADYCRCVIYTEIDEDDFGTITGDTYTFTTLVSNVYDDGLLFLEGSDDLAIELLIPEHEYKYRSGDRWRTYTEEADAYVVKRTPYGSRSNSLGNKNAERDYENVHEISADDITFGRVTGKITFIKAEYVKEVKQDENGTSRLLVLFNDEEIHSGQWREGLNY